jgi:peptide/nickel transport system substrate-binding protein
MRALVLLLSGLIVLAAAPLAGAGPEGQMTWAEPSMLVPAWLDPGEAMILPGTLYALHDALVKPMPGGTLTPSLAESWSTSPDGLVYDFVLRKGVRFHNGEPVTAEDVKFSFERYRGAFASVLKDHVAEVETAKPGRVRIRLKRPWPDFMIFYGTLTSRAGWIVPKQYIEKVGDEGFKRAPVGAGPYRFVSFTPGVELVLEAFDGYWRKTPTVKRLVFRVIPDFSTRLAALKRGEVDIAYSIAAEDIQRTPGFTVKATFPSTSWLYFADQWDPKSPWHDRRVRLAANYAIDRHALNQALTRGLSRITWSIVNSTFDFYWQPPPYPYDPSRARQLLVEAGYPNGFDAGTFFCDVQATALAEALATEFIAIGIRTQVRPIERAAFFNGFVEKKFKNIVHIYAAAFGSAATRLEGSVFSGGTWVYGGYPDLDSLFREQAAELDRTKRAVLLQRMQQLIYDRAMFAPIWEVAALSGVGPRVEESGLGLIPGSAFSAPYEEVKLKTK